MCVYTCPGFLGCFGQVHKHLGHLFVEDLYPIPIKGQWVVLPFEHLTTENASQYTTTTFNDVQHLQVLYLCMYNPVVLWFEGLDFVMTFHTEAKSWGLAGSE